MKVRVALPDLLEVENDPTLLDYRCESTGMVIWPLARGPFLRSLIGDSTYRVPLVDTTARREFARIARAALRTGLYNRRHVARSKGKVIVFAAGLGVQLQDGKFFNRQADHFASVLPTDTVVVEELFDWRWPFPRHNPTVLFHTPLQFCAAVVSRLRLRSRHVRLAEDLLQHVSRRAEHLLGWKLGAQRLEWSIRALAWHIASVPWKRQAYARLLRRSEARVVLKGGACYGGSSIFNLAARELGLKLAEYQHGLISAGHDAYNIAPALQRSADYCATLPDFFLGYGRWWNAQINVPVRKFAIGSPHRSQRLRQKEVELSAKTDVLILGDGIETDAYLGFAQRLAEMMHRRDLRVVFRPHPLERASVLSANQSGGIGALALDKNTDIYESYRSAHAVVGELSTGLFEAVGIVKRIFLWSTAKSRLACPVHPFSSFTDVAHLATQLQSDEAGVVGDAMLEEFWAPNWQRNYLQFLRNVGGIDVEIERVEGAM